MGKIILWILAALLGLCLLYVLFLTVSALLVDPQKEYEHDSPFYRRLLYGATACCIRLLHIHIHVDGMEKLPKDGQFLLVCNHRSNFDPILTWQAMKERNLAFVSKAENFQIPIFGRIIRRCCFMAIDRENPRNALLTIEKAAKLIEDPTRYPSAFTRRGRAVGNASCCPSTMGCSRSPRRLPCPSSWRRFRERSRSIRPGIAAAVMCNSALLKPSPRNL